MDKTNTSYYYTDKIIEQNTLHVRRTDLMLYKMNANYKNVLGLELELLQLPEAVPPVCVTVNDTLLVIFPLTMTTQILPGFPSTAE